VDEKNIKSPKFEDFKITVPEYEAYDKLSSSRVSRSKYG
jgi:hypothetical protein